VPRRYKQGTKSVQLSSAREAECMKLKSPLLEAIASEQLAKTCQAGKGLAGAVVISSVTTIACSSQPCV
jgi:hypothetical protein